MLSVVNNILFVVKCIPNCIKKNGGRVQTAEMLSRGYGNFFPRFGLRFPLNYAVSYKASFYKFG